MSALQEVPTETLALRTASGAPQPAFKLSVVAGPDSGKTFVVDGSTGRVLVGTGPTAHFRLSDPAVSRRHLALWLEEGGLQIEDLGSTNGTRVGSLRVRQAVLEGGESLTIASTAIAVEPTAGATVAVSRDAHFGRVLGASLAMRRLYPRLADLAAGAIPVLIEGEAGTGKELVAEALHEEGPRRDGELFVFDPSTMGEEDIDQELFGGGGAYERCAAGTLVLDEITELPRAAQAKLARLLEGRRVERASGGSLAPADVRVVALSRVDIERAVQDGRLHETLAALCAATRIELPPLRDRTGDVTLLATAFFRALNVDDASLAPLVLRRFEAYTWPGNVRELRTAVHRVAYTGEGATDPRDAFRGAGRETSPSEIVARVLNADLALAPARAIVVEDFERRFVARVLERYGGNVTRAAAASGLARRYFQILRNKHGV